MISLTLINEVLDLGILRPVPTQNFVLKTTVVLLLPNLKLIPMCASYFFLRVNMCV